MRSIRARVLATLNDPLTVQEIAERLRITYAQACCAKEDLQLLRLIESTPETRNRPHCKYQRVPGARPVRPYRWSGKPGRAKGAVPKVQTAAQMLEALWQPRNVRD